MGQLRVEIRLESPHGDTIGEINSLKQDIEAELRAAAEESNIDVEGPRETKPPPDAQGLAEVLQWILEISANNPQVLLQPVLFGLREVISHYRSKDDTQSTSKVTINIVINDITIDLAEQNLELRKQIDEAVEKQSRTDE